MFGSRGTFFVVETASNCQLSRGCESAAQGTDVDQGIQILEQEMSANPMNGEWSSDTAVRHRLTPRMFSTRGEHADKLTLGRGWPWSNSERKAAAGAGLFEA